MIEKPTGPDSNSVVSQCLISFGSNLGDRGTLIADAAKRIAATSIVHHNGQTAASDRQADFRTSRLFETPPIGGPGGQEPFLNAVAAFETRASAREVLGQLQAIEDELGRQRRRRWDARTIDLDVVLHGQLVGGSSALTVPHPRYTARQFVVQPACDVAADYRDPRFGWTLQQLADHLSMAAPSMALVGADEATRRTICRRLRSSHGITVFGLDSDDDPITAAVGQPWVAAYLQALPKPGDVCDAMASESAFAALSADVTIPRLIVRMQRSTKPQTEDTRNWADTTWPAPHQIWPAGWRWPEYRLEIDDLDWAVGELASAIESMRCPVAAVTQDGQWW